MNQRALCAEQLRVRVLTAVKTPELYIFGHLKRGMRDLRNEGVISSIKLWRSLTTTQKVAELWLVKTGRRHKLQGGRGQISGQKALSSKRIFLYSQR